MSVYPRQLGKYELISQLGSGASGEVWKAFNSEQKRFVALKVLRVNQQSPTDLISQFLRSAQQAASLQHPQIVPIYDIQVSLNPTSGTTVAYIVTEYVEGSTLAEYMRLKANAGSVPAAADIIYLFTAIGNALDYAHGRGVAHLNLKPTNILLDKHNTANIAEGEPKITDFGMQQAQKLLTLSLNDAYYLSPEQVQGNVGNARSDLYSLGVMLYQICTGVTPFRGSTSSEIMMQHIHALPPAPSLINPQVMPALAEVIMHSLAKDPAARFATASALATAVANAFSMPGRLSTSQPGFAGDTMNGPTYLSAPRQAALPGMTPLPATFGDSAPAYAAPSASSSAPSQSPLSNPRISQTPGYTAADFATAPAASSYTPPAANNPMTPMVHSAPGYAQPNVQTFPPAQTSGGPPVRQRRRKWPYIAVAVLVIVAIISSSVAVIFSRSQTPASASSPIVGQAFFVSSGQIDLFSDRGIADELQINLQNIANPQAGNSYYAWLLPDSDNDSQVTPISLGQFPVNHGQASILYKGDAQHSNLLVTYSRFLVTEEGSGTTPTNPSLDPKTWRYYSAFSQTPSSGEGTGPRYSVLDHLRHLLAQDPSLATVKLGGGLDIWLFSNMEELLEWSGSARDAQSICLSNPTAGCSAFIQRQATRILDYLDGPYVTQENIPPSIQGTQLLVNPTIAKVALLEFSTSQSPPGYLKHIGNHLRSLIQAPNVSPDQRALAVRITAAIDNVQGWLNAVHTDAAQIVHMDPTQLLQPTATPVVDDLFTKVNDAFVGQTDPNTNQVKEGVAQIHYNIQRLATFNVTACTTGKAANPCL